MRFNFLLLLWVSILAVACGKTSVGRPPVADTSSAQLMVLQPNPFMRPLDLYSVYMDTAKINSLAIPYPGMSRYWKMPSGTRWLFPMLAGTFANYWYYPFYFRPGAHYTMFNVGAIRSSNSNYALVEDDLSAPPSGYAKIRWFQGRSLNWPNEDGPFSWIISGGDTLAKNVGYRSTYPPSDPNYTPDTTAFRVLRAASYLFEIRNTDTPYSFQTSIRATLQAGGIYTLLTVGVTQPDSSLKTGVVLIQNK